MRIPTPEGFQELFQPRARRPRLAVLVGLLLLVVLALVRAKLNLMIGPGGLPFLLFVLAVIGASWLGGWLPGVFTTFACAATALYFFLGVPGEFFPSSPSDQVRTAIFVLVGIIVSGVCEALLSSRERVEEQARQLHIEMQARQVRERERQEMEHRKDEFLAVLAHELRNPLTPIVNAGALLRARQLSDPIIERAAQLIDRHARHMVHLIDDLLDVARIERGTFELRREPVEIERIIEAAAEHSHPAIAERQQRFTVTRPPHAVRVDADYLRMVQVVTNLLNNASAYTPVGGAISLTFSVVGDSLQIEVRDDGQGLAPGERERIFDIFERGSANRAGGGLGIGLALVRQIVHMHGGAVDATSDGEGQGSAFMVRIPGVAVDEPVAPVASPAPLTVEEANRLRILVVDDQADLLESVAALLRLFGHETIAADNGEDALRRMASDRPHVVLMDVGMPGMNGYEVSRRASLEHWRAAMKLVAVTGWGRDEDRQRALDAGFDLHIVKPLDFERLQRMLASFAKA